MSRRWIDNDLCPGGACPVCYPPSSVVGHDGRAEDNLCVCGHSDGAHAGLVSMCMNCTCRRFTAATVGPPKAAPAPEAQKPGESAEHRAK